MLGSDTSFRKIALAAMRRVAWREPGGGSETSGGMAPHFHGVHCSTRGGGVGGGKLLAPFCTSLKRESAF